MLPDCHLMNPTPSVATYPSLNDNRNKVMKEEITKESNSSLNFATHVQLLRDN